MIQQRPNLLPYIVAICLSLLMLAGRGWSADVTTGRLDHGNRGEVVNVSDRLSYSGARSDAEVIVSGPSFGSVYRRLGE